MHNGSQVFNVLKHEYNLTGFYPEVPDHKLQLWIHMRARLHVVLGFILYSWITGKWCCSNKSYQYRWYSSSTKIWPKSHSSITSISVLSDRF